jgi:16S rRNA (guanine966-N2)-methyltransferase
VAGLGLDGAEVRAQRVERLLATAATAEYDVVFADPPYDLDAVALTGVLRSAADHGWLAPDAVVVVERASRGIPWTWPDGFTAVQSRRYGEATLWYGRAAGSSPAPPAEE